jgi:hypothetical protein
MIATSYGGTGFHQAHLAAANFNNTTHNYNISPNSTPMAIGGQGNSTGPATSTNAGSG